MQRGRLTPPSPQTSYGLWPLLVRAVRTRVPGGPRVGRAAAVHAAVLAGAVAGLVLAVGSVVVAVAVARPCDDSACARGHQAHGQQSDDSSPHAESFRSRGPGTRPRHCPQLDLVKLQPRGHGTLIAQPASDVLQL